MSGQVGENREGTERAERGERSRSAGKRQDGSCGQSVCGTAHGGAPEPLARPENIIRGDRYRITVLTERLLRLEYQDEGRFEDRASQAVWYRDLGPAEYTVRHTAAGLVIETPFLTVTYDEKRFSGGGLRARLKSAPQGLGHDWYMGTPSGNLGGTARTLDGADGAVPLEDGVIAMDGFAVLDDSKSVRLETGADREGPRGPEEETGEAHLLSRAAEEGDTHLPGKSGDAHSPGDLEIPGFAAAYDGSEDYYLFAYGHDYKAAVRDYYRLTGFPALLPRYALGNWWSRYYAYSEESYLELMRRFDEEGIPFSVAVIDMDWHLVDIDPEYGDGWTGYTWNRKLFPDPERFLGKLHDRGMRVTLNVHPAGGVRAFEEAYPEMARAMGIDPETGETVAFDAADPQFLRAYLDILHHPLEEQGTDFWWIDWQQGTHTRIPNLDPLWVLNHVHYYDNARKGLRPMIFSRYAGPGSQRYAVGFSGDSIISWDSLRFQPYFTATAANIGYGWWSHDIGGHMLGEKSDVMQLRWLQFGTFSPILRLHSSNSAFSGKEPWNYRPEVRAAADEFLRLRHRLIPYLYTMNYRAAYEGEPIVRPMYWEYPEEPDAYPSDRYVWKGHPNQYFFGTEMIAAPITEDLIPSVGMGRADVWLPDGIWHDFFTGLIYRGGRSIAMYRDLSSIPVLVRAGGIVPMTEEIFGKAFDRNPESVEVRMYGGADGAFGLYEDDGRTEEYQNGAYASTQLQLYWEASEIVISAASGRADLLPKERRWTILLMGVRQNVPRVFAGEEEIPPAVSYDERTGCLRMELPPQPTDREIGIVFAAPLSLRENHEKERLMELLIRAQTDNAAKERSWEALLRCPDSAAALSQMEVSGLDEDVRLAAAEILTADPG